MFRASNAIPQQAFLRAKILANNLKTATTSTANDFQSGSTSERILDLLGTMISYKEQFALVQNAPGIAQYARDQEGDQSYDIVQEFLDLLALIDTVIANIIATFPTDGGGFLLAESLDGEGNRVQRTFSAGNLAGIRADLNAVANGIS